MIEKTSMLNGYPHPMYMQPVIKDKIVFRGGCQPIKPPVVNSEKVIDDPPKGMGNGEQKGTKLNILA